MEGFTGRFSKSKEATPRPMTKIKKPHLMRIILKLGSSPSRVGDFGLISYRVEHAGEDFEAQVLLVA